MTRLSLRGVGCPGGFVQGDFVPGDFVRGGFVLSPDGLLAETVFLFTYCLSRRHIFVGFMRRIYDSMVRTIRYK